MVSGGAKRTTVSCVSFDRMPRAIINSHTRRALTFAGSKSTPIHNPLPRMPVISGVELCSRLRKKVKAGLRIVALTAQVLPEEKEALLQQGFDDVLIKPFREADLLRMIGKRDTGAEAIAIENSMEENEEEEIGLREIVRMSMNDTELLKSNLQMLITESNKDIASLRARLASGNAKQVAETAHRLAGKMAQAGAKVLAARFRAIEKETANGNIPAEQQEEITAACAATSILVEKVRDYLRRL